MTDHFHDIRNLVGSDDASSLALGTDLCWHAMFVGLEYGGLVKTDGGCVDIHITENDIRLRDSSRQS